MTEETWKTHPTLGIEVSDKGRVLIPKNGAHAEHITYGSDCNGYKCVSFKKKLYKVHRLVAEAFIENPHHLPCVNHKDEDKSNNSVDNLEYCTHSYNTNYGTCQKRRVANTDYKAIAAKIDWKTKVAHTDYKAIAEKQSKTVYQYTKEGVLVNTFPSTHECGRNGYNQGNITQCCNGKRKTHKGYIWSYENRI